MKFYICILCGIFTFHVSQIEAQVFNDSKLINLPSVELLDKHQLDVRIGHRFGDIGGESGGWKTLYGIENAADVQIGAQYGLGKYLTIGLNRSKGVGPLKQLINLEGKLGLLDQYSDNPKPLSLVIMVEHTTSTMPRSEVGGSLTAFTSFAHRMMTSGQLIIAREFQPWLSAQVNTGIVHRNIVISGDVNDLFFVGSAVNFRMTKVLGMIAEVIFPFPASANDVLNRQPQLGLGFEIFTGGHVFTIKLTNTKALSISDGVAYTTSMWREGEFRIGFTISRIFNL